VSDETMKYVLLHEWNHFTNRDMWVKLITKSAPQGKDLFAEKAQRSGFSTA